ncbi:glycosyltransferase family 4 protein [Actinoallomurus sp. NPDC052274]|uniref:glycosyltransferase family 4 protein n=1 Tax=Actinoallomurus sp. NPDC052274 TaxID=3155420 RepID=UPI003425C779
MTRPCCSAELWEAGRHAGPDSFGVLRFTSVFEPLCLSPDWAAYDPIGGMQTHTAELTRCLDRMGIRQTVFTSRLAGPAGRRRYGSGAVVVRTGLRVPVLRQVWAPSALARALGPQSAADVVHAHSGEDLAVLPVAWLAAVRHGCPLVVTLHSSLRHTVRGTSPRAAALRLLGGPVERRVLAAADAVIALTPSAARRLRADGMPPDHVHVIPSGFDPDLFAAARPDPFPDVPHPRIAYVGRLAAQKGVAVLLDAFARCRVRATLLIVGDGPQRAALERRARRLRGEVRFTGLIPHAEVPAVLRHADLLVLPSVYEELGSVLVEAMAVGLPVVAGRVGGVPDLVRDGVNGLLVAPKDPAAFAGAVDRVLADSDLAGRLGTGARETVRGHTWPALAERVAAVYRQVLSGRLTPARP